MIKNYTEYEVAYARCKELEAEIDELQEKIHPLQSELSDLWLDIQIYDNEQRVLDE
jgi:predicted nuclease with TOPRIM domain